MSRQAPAATDAFRGTASGGFPYTRADFRRIADLLRADAGIQLNETKAPLVYARLIKRLRALGLQSFRDYCALVSSGAGAEERRRMASALTTNVTRFFREPHHFAHLKALALPPLIRRAREGGRVRIWSAGCSTGEEPYSIALTLLSMMPEAADRDIRILATDIDEDVLAAARHGRYGETAVARIETGLRKRWLAAAQDERGAPAWAVSAPLRALVAFRELNLTGVWPMRGPFDLIFCRNTVIYFDPQLQSQIWARMAPLLSPGGFLYVGHSERVWGTDALHIVAATTYARTSRETG
jgi:chemotaxis protein methyltransferase CheR